MELIGLVMIILTFQSPLVTAELTNNEVDILPRPNSKLAMLNTLHGLVKSTTSNDSHPLDINIKDICLTEACTITASSILTKIDNTISPCQDFHSFACGKWQKKHKYKLAEGQLFYAINYNILPEEVNKILKRLLRRTERLERTFYSSQPYRLLADFYDSCMDEETIKQQGSEPAINFLKNLRKFQFGKPFDKSLWNLEEAMIELLKLNAAVFFDISLDPQLNDESNWDVAVSLPNHDILTPSSAWAQRDKLKERAKFRTETFFGEGKDRRRFDQVKRWEEQIFARSAMKDIYHDGNDKISKGDKLHNANHELFRLGKTLNDADNSDSELLVNTLQNEYFATPKRTHSLSAKNDCIDNQKDMTTDHRYNISVSRKKYYSKIKESSDLDAFLELKTYLEVILNATFMAEANSTNKSTFPKTFEDFLNTVSHFAHEVRQAEPTLREKAIDTQNGKVFTLYTMKQLQTEYPIINWTSVSSRLMETEVLSNTSVVVNFPQYLQKINILLSKSEPWLIHYGMLSIFAKDVLKKLTTISVEPTRGNFCFETSKEMFPDVYAYMYLKYVGIERINKLNKTLQPFVSSLTDTLVNKINSSPWMSQSDKKTAITKIDNINWQLGGTEKWLNLTLLTETYTKFSISNSSLFNNVIKVFKLARRELYSLYRDQTKFDKESEIWILSTSPYVINAFYLLSENSIVAPSALFNPPYFYPDAPNYINYGAIGVALAHEMVHSMDYTGSLFDTEGRYRRTFTDGYQQQVRNRMKCFNCMIQKYFTKYSTIHRLPVKFEIDNELTHNENYADIIGLSTAYDAFEKQSSDKNSNQLLPGSSYTREQLFFLSFAQPYCALLPSISKVVLMEFDEHLPHDIRINALLKNSAKFSEAFGCTRTDPMYSGDGCPML